MRSYHRFRCAFLATAICLVVLLATAACGNDENDSATPTTVAPKGTLEPTRAAVTSTPTRGPASVLTPGTTPAPDVAAPGVEYVREMCNATEAFVGGVGKKLQSDPSLASDNSRLLPVFGPVVQDYATVIAALKPPVEWKADHDRFVTIMRELVAKMRSGEVKSFADFNVYVLGTGKLKPLNETAFKRIDEIIGQTEECANVGFIFGGL